MAGIISLSTNELYIGLLLTILADSLRAEVRLVDGYVVLQGIEQLGFLRKPERRPAMLAKTRPLLAHDDEDVDNGLGTSDAKTRLKRVV